MGALKPWHIILLVVVLVLLFGAKRLPDAARSLGRSLRIIKAETKGLVDDDNDLAEKAEPQYGRQPVHPTEIHPSGPAKQQPYQQQPPPAAPYVDPVQRTRDH
jgi:sec-independent protein translocase protein TatA